MTANKILIPFSVTNNQAVLYTEAINFAKANQVDIVMCTYLPKDSSEEKIDEAYLHVLDLNGKYLANTNGWAQGMPINIQTKVITATASSFLSKAMNEVEPSYIVQTKLVQKLSSTEALEQAYPESTIVQF